MSKKDYYEILGASKDNSVEEIKKIYKKLALKFHPDMAPEDKKEEYGEKFKEISEAYAVLSDSEKRSQYDNFGHNSFDQRYSQEDIFRGTDFSSILEELFGRGFGGFSNRGQERSGSDLQYPLTISFEESVSGVDKEIEFKKNVLCKKCSGTGAKDDEVKTCEECKGSGRKNISRKTMFGVINQTVLCEECHGRGKIPIIHCEECHGNGIVNEMVKIKIEIPSGVDTGNVLIVEGKGEEIQDGENGDLHIVFRVTPHKIFHREGDDIQMIYEINFSQAVMGDKIEILTPYGKTKIKIPSGFATGTVMRIKGKGMENVRGYGKGDLFVKINIKTPTRLSRKQKKVLEEWKKLEE